MRRLTGAENILLGAQRLRGPAIDWAATRADAARHLHEAIVGTMLGQRVIVGCVVLVAVLVDLIRRRSQ